MVGGIPDPPLSSELPESARAVRAQLLATEHWSLLASRSTAQGEVLTRIQMHLTLVSASLLTLALLGSATRFAGPFPILACGLLAVVLLIGVLTQVRVVNVANEDLMYVLAMNRLRGAYARLSPGIEDDLVTGSTDDRDGVRRTYYALAAPRSASQVLGSSLIFSGVVNAVLAGLLIGTVIVVSGGPLGVAVAVGTVIAVAYVALSVPLGARGYLAAWRAWRPRYPGKTGGGPDPD